MKRQKAIARKWYNIKKAGVFVSFTDSRRRTKMNIISGYFKRCCAIFTKRQCDKITVTDHRMIIDFLEQRVQKCCQNTYYARYERIGYSVIRGILVLCRYSFLCQSIIQRLDTPILVGII